MFVVHPSPDREHMIAGYALPDGTMIRHHLPLRPLVDRALAGIGDTEPEAYDEIRDGVLSELGIAVPPQIGLLKRFRRRIKKIAKKVKKVAGLIGAGSAILSSLLAGVFTIAATTRAMAQAELREMYVRALEDIAALRALEERYLSELGQRAGETPEAAKRRIWAAHEDAGGRKPSTSAEAARVARKLERLR